ncbi:2068_t:CDS:2 [Racocetra fulgida]|uniref:2068_t:CDS:1 n=1 Tax=Racocetra fulgida TaxID=60492 RepID=A0A9N9AFX3_9GLOM|nr:2068_t:CDS:2 [Racocetra fulgida]
MFYDAPLQFPNWCSWVIAVFFTIKDPVINSKQLTRTSEAAAVMTEGAVVELYINNKVAGLLEFEAGSLDGDGPGDDGSAGPIGVVPDGAGPASEGAVGPVDPAGIVPDGADPADSVGALEGAVGPADPAGASEGATVGPTGSFAALLGRKDIE